MQAYHCAISNLNVTDCSHMNLLNVCYNNLSALTVNGCTGLRTFNIFCNQITEDNMTALVNSLPTVPAGSGTIRALYYTDEANVVTAAHVRAANQKGWNVQHNTGSSWVNIDASVTRGDVDGEGNVNMDDLTALINYLLTSNSAGINLANAAICDSPSSTTVTMDDLTALINFLLTNAW